MTDDSVFLIVVGIDGSEHSRVALAWAVEEAHRRNGQLRLITAWSNAALSWYPAVLESAAGGIPVPEDSPEEIARALQAVALKSAESEGLVITGEVVHNHSPASAILECAQDADLIVVGSRGHGGFSGLNLGSVCSQIVHHASCSVLVTRSKAS